jgi:chromosome segregation ATPase
VTTEDRHVQASRLRAFTVTVRDVCRRMRAQFEAVVHSEELIRRIVHDQLRESAQSAHSLTAAVSHRVISTARSEFDRVGARLHGIQDEIQDASRRMDTLNEARVREEQRVDGPEIPVFAALEEMVAASNELHDLRDMRSKVEAMCTTCGAALRFLQDLNSAVGACTAGM